MSGRIIRLYRENHDTADGRRLVDTTWGDVTPVILGDLGDTAIGAITEIVRNPESGWVTGFLTTDHDVIGLAAQAGFDGGEYAVGEAQDGQDGVMVYTGARLRYVLLGSNPVWEGMEI